MRIGLRAGVVAALAGGVLLAPAAADAKRFSVKAPGPGQVVIAQVRGTSTGNKPPRLTLTNPGALRGTVIASSIWKAKAGGAAYDGVIVLIRKAGQASSARTPAGARRPAIFNSPVILTVGLIVNLHVTLKLLEPTVERIREAARRTQCKNNLKSLALEVHNSYYGSPRPPTPPRTAVRYVCGGLDDQTVAGAPRFWNFFGQPSCAIHVVPFGTAGDEVQISGHCNRAVGAFGVFPPPPFMATACLPFAGVVLLRTTRWRSLLRLPESLDAIRGTFGERSGER